MPYLSAAELLERFCAEEIAQRADRGIPRRVTAALLSTAAAGGSLAGFTAAEQEAALAALGLVNAALADASAQIDGYVATRYRVPLDPAPGSIKRLAGDLARYQLYDDAVTETIQKRRDEAIAELRDIAAGKSVLVDLAGIEPVDAAKAGVRVSARAPIFDAASLERY